MLEFHYLTRIAFATFGVLRSSIVFTAKVNMKLFQSVSTIQATPFKFYSSSVLVNFQCRSMTIVLQCSSNQASWIVKCHFQSWEISVFGLALVNVNWGLVTMSAFLPFLVPIRRTRHYGEIKLCT